MVVNETPYTQGNAGRACMGLIAGPAGQMPQFAPVVVSPKSFVLADQLAFCRFSYLVTPPAPGGGVQLLPPQWATTGTGTGWPAAIRVEMAPLHADPSHLQPITVTAPIRIRRSPQIQYGDY